MDYISIKEASELWGMDPSNIGKLARSGKIVGAKIVGRNWLIPKNTPKPVDGRTKQAKSKKEEVVFRFPLLVNFEENSFSPPLSAEEKMLYQAQKDFYACAFQSSKPILEALSESAESIYVKICAHYYMCLLSVSYDPNISWAYYYGNLSLLLLQDFPYKKEMELFLPFLDLVLARYANIPEAVHCSSTYVLHPSAWYLNILLSAFCALSSTEENPVFLPCNEPFDTLCRIMERDGFFIEAQQLHLFLHGSNYTVQNTEAMLYHLKEAVRIAFEHNLLFPIADLEPYYPDEFHAILLEYPDTFAKKIRANSSIIYDNYSLFVKKIQNSDIIEKLSKNDYRLVFYAILGYTIKEVAELCKVSDRTVVNRYNEIYEKLNVKNKRELVTKMTAVYGYPPHEQA